MLDLEWLCCEESSFCVSEPEVFYMELVDEDLCIYLSTEAFDLVCDINLLTPTKQTICDNKDQFADEFADYIMDVDVLCGYTEEDGTVVESETQALCDAWDDACTDDIPSVTYMCENIYNAPDAFFEAFEVFGTSAFDFCWDAQDFEDFDVEDFCSEDSDFSDVCVDGYPDFV